MNAPKHTPDYLTLRAASLCSKWGFCDGDILSEDPYYGWIVEAIGDESALYEVEHDALCALIERHLLPALPVSVNAYRLHTLHNPYRVDMVDGEPWDSYTAESHPALQDVSVQVPRADVVAAVRAALAKAEGRQP